MRRAAVAALVFAVWLGATGAMSGQPRAASPPLTWQASVGPFTGYVTAFAEAESGTLFAYVDTQVYRSIDDGVTWTRCESQPVKTAFYPWLLTTGRRLYASGGPGEPMYASDDDCVSSRSTAPPTSSSARETVTVVGGATLLAAYDGLSLFRSPDGGLLWTEVSTPPVREPRLTTNGSTAFLLLSQRLYRSRDQGTTWAQTAEAGPAFYFLVPGGSSLYAAASGGVWRSLDDGTSWARVLEASSITAVTARGQTVYASLYNPPALVRSTDGGNSWSRHPLPLTQVGLTKLLQTRRGTLLAGTMGIFRSTDGGSSWTATGVRGHGVRNFSAGGGSVYASLANETFWKSGDGGLTWARVDMSFAGSPRPLRFPVAFQTLLSLEDGVTLRASTDRELLASRDGGRSWTMSGLSWGVNALVRLREAWFAATQAGVFRSDDLVRWTECSSGLQSGSVRGLTATPDGDLIALEDFYLYRSADLCASWWPLTQRPPIRRRDGYLARSLLVSDPTIGIAVFGDGIAQLSLPERKWIVRAETPLITAFVSDDEGRHWVGTSEGVAQLLAEGAEWRLVPMGLEGRTAALTIVPEGYLLASVEGRGIYRARLP